MGNAEYMGTPVARTPARETLEVPSCVDPDLTESSAGDTDVLNLDSQESTPRPATSSHGSTLTCKFFLTLFHSFNKFSNSIKFAVQYNDVDVASMLLQRGAVNETDVLEEAIFDCNVEIVTILLESGADVHAEVDFGGGPTPIYEWCAQYLLFYEEENANYSSVHELERLKKINKLVMEKKEK